MGGWRNLGLGVRSASCTMACAAIAAARASASRCAVTSLAITRWCRTASVVHRRRAEQHGPRAAVPPEQQHLAGEGARLARQIT